VAAAERVTAWLTKTAEAGPPKWVRFSNPLIFVLFAVGGWQRRGWGFGLISTVIFAATFLPMAVNPGAVKAWSRRHPRLDGLTIGPILFGSLGLITHISLWWWILAGLAASAFGLAMGQRKARLRRQGRHTPA
jgi:hypothetical protein